MCKPLKKNTECEFKKEKKDRIELNALISEYDSGWDNRLIQVVENSV